MDGEYNENTNLWQLKGKFIQVGNGANDFVNLTMNAADGGEGCFLWEGCDEITVPAMKNNIFPIVAMPEAGKILLV